MAIITILVAPPDDPREQNTWSFEHAMAHRRLMAVMGPINKWSGMPYFVDPQDFQAVPANHWNATHQYAHNDFNAALPADVVATTSGISQAQILEDTSQKDPRSIQWWIFANMQEHYNAEQAILPLNTTGATPRWVEPQLVTNYW